MPEITARDFADRELSMSYSFDEKNTVDIGDPIYFTAHLSGYEGLIYSINWQYSLDGNMWANIPGAESEQYMLVLDYTNINWTVRVAVTITGVVEQ